MGSGIGDEMKPAVRKELSFIRQYLVPPKDASPEDMLSPFDVARLMREEAHLNDTEQLSDAKELRQMLSRHHEAVQAMFRTGMPPTPLTVKMADAEALDAAQYDIEVGIDY